MVEVRGEIIFFCCIRKMLLEVKVVVVKVSSYTKGKSMVSTKRPKIQGKQL